MVNILYVNYLVVDRHGCYSQTIRNATGTYDVQLATRNRENRGILQLSANGTNLGAARDQYYPAIVWQ